MALTYLMVERMLRLAKRIGLLLAKRNGLLLAERIGLMLLVVRREAGKELAGRKKC